MITIGACEAKIHLPRLLDEVAAGGSFIITRNGVPMAMLVPAPDRRPDPASTIQALRSGRQGVRLGAGSLRDLIDGGRR